MNGMFALALWDATRNELILARDHFGIKPLYYTVRSGRLAFASEMKALLESEEVPRRINLEALDYFLTFLWIPEPLTLLEGVFKLPPGHSAVFRNGKLAITEYWDLRFPADKSVFRSDLQGLALETRERFSACVRSQLLSDVPVGAFLSAGLDSSSIVAAMAGHSRLPVETFTITFPEQYRSSGIILDDLGGTALAAIALLAFTGIEGENVDIVAHIAGLVVGIACGAAVASFDVARLGTGWQLLCGIATLGAVASAWLLAGSTA
jgi:asparagine synthase (glutamine-hydrolysing)